MIRAILAVLLAAAFRPDPWDTGPREALGAEVAAQTRPPPVYEREVFTYPGFDRRDPFRPLHLDTREGPRFGDLTLAGVVYNPQLGSVAVLTDRTTGRRYRARERDTIGTARVARIGMDAVDFVITSFGVSRRETLRVRREGGTDR